MGDARACVPKVATPCVCGTRPPGSATHLHTWKTCEGDAGRLASIAYLREDVSPGGI
jgi:hypothetical protein